MKGFLPRIFNYLGLLPRLNIIQKIRLNGKYFQIPVVKKIGLQNILTSSSWFLELSERLLPIKKGGLIDVGANVGQTLLQFKGIDENSLYIGFEPNISCCYYINELTKANGFGNTIILPMGLSDKDGINKFFVRTDEDTGATFRNDLRPGFFKPDQFQFVPAFSLDTVIPHLAIETIAIIKIDVEGGELEVLGGMGETVQRYRPFIICEVLDFSTPAIQTSRQERADKVSDLIRKWNFDIFKIQLSDEGLLQELVKVENITLKQWTKKSRLENDYLFCPSELKNDLINSSIPVNNLKIH